MLAVGMATISRRDSDTMKTLVQRTAGAADLERTIAGLRARRYEIEARLAKLTEEHAATALAALTGDPAAQKRLDGMAAAEAKAGRELVDLDAAAAGASGLLTEARQAEAQAERVRRIAEARALAAQRIIEAEAVDRALQALSGAVAAYHATGAALERFEDVTAIDSTHLFQPYRIGSAFAEVDGALFRALDGRPVSRAALADSERAILNQLIDSHEEE